MPETLLIRDGFLNLKKKLEPAEPGLFRLKDEYKKQRDVSLPTGCDPEVRFMLTSEISSIYKKNGKVRRVHNVIFVPDFKSAEGIQKELLKRGANITYDGRPIVGLDSRDLLEITLNVSEDSLFVPAHIWTPWFSMLGSKSGFDSVEECFGDLGKYIFAVETGLSADPPMHWICSFLDKCTLLSNSDAHSPEKIGRNANVFDTDMSYYSIIDAVKKNDPERFLGTIDLFPQEGKYHYDGHRKCSVCWDPLETLKKRGVCPVCGNDITIGVMNRVAGLSDRADLSERKKRLPFTSIIPLKEILSEIAGTGPTSKKVDRMYFPLLHKWGSELNILMNVAVEDIAKSGNEILGEAIRRMRNREVIIKEGFDGEYGRIKVFADGEVSSFGNAESLFDDISEEKRPLREKRNLINFDLEEYRRLANSN
ncbi:MAG: endonuclease Q family protein [Candidatus Omnitrophota bacterium]